MQVTGFHHITCVGSHPRQNLEFYSGILGLRLVKKTVHFDREEVYHLYYGDDRGRPGTVLTFFPFTNPEPAIRGSNSIQEIAFAVPESSQDFWKTRFEAHRVDADFWVEEFGQPALRFRDHDGQRLKLVAVTDSGSRSCWQTGPILTEHAIRGLQGVRLGVIDADAELVMLTELLGLIYSAKRGNVTRLNFRMPSLDVARDALSDSRQANPESRIPGYVDVEAMPGVAPAPRLPLEGAPAMAGTTNHVAFATENEQSQLEFRERLVDAGLTLTPVKDRRYFKSIYMIDRCGVRLEIATEGPGFTVDESPDQLGEALKLPPWLEHLRPVYEASLPELPSSIHAFPRWLSSAPGN